MEMPSVNLAPETLFTIGSLPVSNAMITSVAVSILVIIFALLVRVKAGVKPSKMQVLFEAMMNFILDKMIVAFGSKERALQFFPLIFTIFLFLLFGNLFMILPFAESIATNDGTGISIFRAPASHYALPIVFTLFILVLAHVLALAVSPIKHIGNFIKIKAFLEIRSLKDVPMACLDFFLGLLDIVGEFAKLASLSTRLFGNMFAGSIIVLIISSLTVYTRYLVPVPFVALGILASVVQAFVFTMLSILYISSTLNAVKPPETTN